MPVLFYTLFLLFSWSLCTTTGAITGAFIIELADGFSLQSFHDNAKNLKYTIRHTFDKPGIFVGLSVTLSERDSPSDQEERLASIPGVKTVSQVVQYEVPVEPVKQVSSLDHQVTRSLMKRQDDPGNFDFTLAMGGVDKLHEVNIKGNGIKVGFVDTGIDYNHPALGAGYGPGKKIAGGYTFIADDGTLVEGPDPFANCSEAHHATHVAGIVGMEPLEFPEGFPITGVAPEASLYVYRVFSCQSPGNGGRGGTNEMIMKAMMKALDDQVDILSMSLSLNDGQVSPIPKSDPVAGIAQKLHDAGIAVSVAMGNTGSPNAYSHELHTQTLPSELSTVIAVGSIANVRFPLVYTNTDSSGAELHYASIWPINRPDGLDVYVIEGDGCDSSAWENAVNFVQANGTLNNTIIVYQTTDSCRPQEAPCCRETAAPPYILAADGNNTNVYNMDYESPLPDRFNDGATKAYTMIPPDAVTLLSNYQAAGGFGNYKLFFSSNNTLHPKQRVGGEPDWFTSYGPIWHTYELKPQISAPGGHILSTFPLPLGGYGIISGTSMATPYIAGCYALVKSQFPTLSIDEILVLLQTTATPVTWPYNEAMLATTAQQGAGLVNAYDAIMAQSRVSPGQLVVSDNNRTTFGVVNFTVENRGDSTQAYTLGHRGAGFTNDLLNFMEMVQRPVFGSADFPTPTFDLAPGAATQIFATVIPPVEADAQKRPIFGGYIDIVPATGANLSIPYSGPAFSPFNTDYITYIPADANGERGQPAIYFVNETNGERLYDIGFVEVNRTAQYGSLLNRIQWTTLWRVDILPANTTIPAHRYGANITVPGDYVYEESVDPLAARLFSYPSYGNLFTRTGLEDPGTRVFPSGRGFTVTDDAVQQRALGPGDYRWYFSVLRMGGDPGQLGDYDSWLGPIIRFT